MNADISNSRWHALRYGSVAVLQIGGTGQAHVVALRAYVRAVPQLQYSASDDSPPYTLLSAVSYSFAETNLQYTASLNLRTDLLGSKFVRGNLATIKLANTTLTYCSLHYGN